MYIYIIHHQPLSQKNKKSDPKGGGGGVLNPHTFPPPPPHVRAWFVRRVMAGAVIQGCTPPPPFHESSEIHTNEFRF